MFPQAQSLSFRLMRIAVIALLTVVFLLVTHPARVPALLLVVPFIGVYACLYCIVLEVIRFLRPAPEGDDALTSARRPRLLSALIAAFPVLLLVLQSIMELNRWDIVIALAIFLLAYVFVSRGSLPGGR